VPKINGFHKNDFGNKDRTTIFMVNLMSMVNLSTLGAVALLLSVSITNLSAQNKTLGVGTATPNPNAAMHVEAPTNNQGIIIPRLTTAQRAAFTASLTAAPADIGLILYDTDLRALAVWNGTGWDIGSKVGAPITINNGTGAGSAAVLANSNAANASTVVQIDQAGTGTGLNLNLTNPSTTSSGLNINQNGNGYSIYSKSTGTNENAWFEVSNPTSSGSPIVGITNGTGVAGYFQVNNPTSATSAINGITNGTGLAGLFQVNNPTSGTTALEGTTNSNLGGALAPVGVYGQSTGTGSLGGSFRNTNVANIFPALYAETKGLNNTAAFKTKNPANNFPALYVETDGTGGAANFTTFDATSSNPGVVIIYAGTGKALQTTGDISAGKFIGDGSLLTNLPAAGGGLLASNNLSDVSNTSTARINLGLGSLAALNTVSTNDITDNSILNKDIDPAAFIAGSKIDPNFGFQNILTGGNISVSGAGKFIGDGSLLTNLPGGGSGWALTGNSGTNSSTDFIGTTDAKDFTLKTNNTEVIKFFSSGQIGIGSTPVSAKLDLQSTSNAIGIYSALNTVTSSQNRALEGFSQGSTTQNIGVYGTGIIDNSNGAIGVYGEGIGNGSADAYGLYGMTNNFTTTTGTTYGVYATAEGGATNNWAGFFDKGNVRIKNSLFIGLTPSNPLATVDVNQSGAGGAAVFQVTNGSNSVAALSTTTNGTGAAFDADQTGNGFGITVKSRNTDAIHATKLSGDGIGSAGFFSNAEPANVASTVFATTNAPGAPALGLANTAGGNAFAIFSGGVQLSAITVSVAGTITTKSGLYEITTSGSFSLPVSGNVGETCLVSNATGGSITVESILIPTATVRQFIRITTVGWKVVN
jgi:hypothetical protein